MMEACKRFILQEARIVKEVDSVFGVHPQGGLNRFFHFALPRPTMTRKDLDPPKFSHSIERLAGQDIVIVEQLMGKLRPSIAA